MKSVSWKLLRPIVAGGVENRYVVSFSLTPREFLALKEVLAGRVVPSDLPSAEDVHAFLANAIYRHDIKNQASLPIESR